MEPAATPTPPPPTTLFLLIRRSPPREPKRERSRGRDVRHQPPQESGAPREAEKRLRERGEGEWEDPKPKAGPEEAARPRGVVGRESREREGEGEGWAASVDAIGIRKVIDGGWLAP